MPRDVVEKGRFGRNALRRLVRMHLAVVDAAREAVEPLAHRAIAAHQVGLLHGLELADGADAVRLQRRVERLADAPDGGDRPGRQEFQRLFLPDHRKAAGLLEVGGNLGEEFAIGEADRNADTDLVLHPLCEFREDARRGA